MLTVNRQIEKITKWNQEEFDLELAILLVSQEKISSKKAVELLQHISHKDFLTLLEERNIFIHDWQALELLNEQTIPGKNK